MNKLSDDQLKQGETQLKRSEAMINSMTSRNVVEVRLVGDGGLLAALVIGDGCQVGDLEDASADATDGSRWPVCQECLAEWAAP